jgi:hypothetical protein
MYDEDVRVRSWCVASTKKDNSAWLYLGKWEMIFFFTELFNKAFEVWLLKLHEPEYFLNNMSIRES